jgi:hypothetical protein
MHASQRAFRFVMGNIRLRYDWLQAVSFEFVLTERSRKESARILTSLEVDDEGALQFCLDKDHGIFPINEIVLDFVRSQIHAFKREREPTWRDAMYLQFERNFSKTLLAQNNPAPVNLMRLSLIAALTAGLATRRGRRPQGPPIRHAHFRSSSNEDLR